METPFVGRTFCPTCEPEADEIGETLIVRWCADHIPVLAGVADAAVPDARPFLSGSGEADGHDCRAMARLLR